MLIVLDDVLDEDRRQTVAKYFSENDQARQIQWQEITQKNLQDNLSPLGVLLKKASLYFDLSCMVGVEYWSHFGTRPEWHVDKDEKLYERHSEVKFPICSIVYYADVNVVGGNFLTKTVSVKPIANRMLIFAQNLLHGVEPYTGTRLSIAVNPWDTKPMAHI